MSEEEKAKLEELYENSEWWHNRFNAVQRDYEKLQQKIDKAIKYIETHKEERKIFEPYGTPTGIPNRVEINIKGYYDLLEILGDKE